MRKHRGAPSEQEEQAEDGEAAKGFRQLALTPQPKLSDLLLSVKTLPDSSHCCVAQICKIKDISYEGLLSISPSWVTQYLQV